MCVCERRYCLGHACSQQYNLLGPRVLCLVGVVITSYILVISSKCFVETKHSYVALEESLGILMTVFAEKVENVHPQLCISSALDLQT